MTKLILGLSILAPALLASNQVRAVQVLDEPFSYPNGTTLTSTGNYVAISGGGTLPITANNGVVTLTNLASGTSGEDLRRGLGTSYTTGLLYYSALVTVTSAPTSANGDYFFSGYNSPTTNGGYFGRVFLSATATGFAFGLSNAATAPADGSDIVLNTQYKIVLRLDLDAKTSTLGVFDPSVTPTSDASLSIVGAGIVSPVAGIDSFAFRQGSAAGSAFGTVFDGVQVGTTLTDVSAISAVPEPSTYALIGGAFGLLLIGQRSRRSRGTMPAQA